MSSKLRHITLFSGNTILGDGAVVLIIDPNRLARMVGSGSGDTQFQADEPAEQSAAEADETVTLLVFRGGGESLKAVPLSLVTRLEEIDAAKIEWLGGRPLVQYRGRLMPLVAADETLAIRREGSQPLVVFSDGERTMGLAVAEIVDIVDDRLDIQLVTDRSDLVGSAVIRGRATEVVNVAHYLPLAHDDWTRPAAARTAASIRSVLLVDDSAFFRDMLTPVLKASGYKVLTAAGTEEALALIAGGASIDALITDVEMPDRDGFQLVEALRADARFGALPVIALSSSVNPDAINRARKLRIAEFVAKFDRSGLLSALAETHTALGEAA
jgi:two-component system chemotaxis sensor kinase CheA